MRVDGVKYLWDTSYGVSQAEQFRQVPPGVAPPPQVIKSSQLTSAWVVSYSAGQDTTEGGGTSCWRPTVRVKCHSGILLYQVVFQESKINYFMAQKLQQTWHSCHEICGRNLGNAMAKSTPVHSIARPTILSRIYTITMEGLNTYGTPWEPSEWIKSSVVEAFLVIFWSF